MSNAAVPVRIPGKFVWFELEAEVALIARARAFYAELLGYSSVPFAVGDQQYEMIACGGTPLGGYAPQPGACASRWIGSVSVADVDAAASRAVVGGGKLIQPAADIPNVGRVARIADPFGAELHLYSALAGDPPDADAAPGSFFWNELHTAHPAEATRFYAALLGYSVEVLDLGPGGSYHVLASGGAGRAGVSGQLPVGTTSHWLPYVRVEDPDATLARAARLGARIVVPAQDIPNTGRHGVLQDPTGAALAVMRPAPRAA